jgi:hypothetical protein
MCAIMVIVQKERTKQKTKEVKTMKVYSEMSIRDFEAWSGAVDTKDKIIANDKEDEFDALIEELYPDGIDETQLNDLLWFDDEWILESLGIYEDDDEDEEFD